MVLLRKCKKLEGNVSKVAHYLQEHISGEVVTSPDVRRFFATDASILTLTPSLVVYPRNEQDVRKTARFAWQLAEKGRALPITARGSGTDTAGGALGDGIILAFPAHMNRIVEFDPKSGTVKAEPGLNYGRLQQTLHTHGRFLPPYPASYEYSTLGGATANNASGEQTLKYGSTRGFVRSLRVVLSNGDVIVTERLNKRELNKKLGLSSFEGEIYRAVDALLEENRELVEKIDLPVTKNTAGYDLLDIKRLDGSCDLTPLFVGSQGTLGIITEITLDTEAYTPSQDVFLAEFDSLEQLQQAVLALRELPDLPSSMEIVDSHALEAVEHLSPNLLSKVVAKPFASAVMLVEFDGSVRSRKKIIARAKKILDTHARSVTYGQNPGAIDDLRKVRDSVSLLLAGSEDKGRALPFIEDLVVPPAKVAELMDGIYKICNHLQIKPAIWGSVGDGNLHIQPSLEIAQVGDRQKLFRLMDECYRLAISLGGSTSGQNGDGRLRAPYLQHVYGDEVYGLFKKIKQVFDPHSILNPHVKLGSSLDNVKAIVRSDYSLRNVYDHLPRS